MLRGELAQMEMKMPGREVRPGVWVGLNTAIDWDQVSIEGPAYIGSNVRLEPGARIVGPTWIGHGSQLRRGARVEQCILFEYTRLGEDQHFAHKIVSPQYCVDHKGETLYAGDIDCSLRWGDARA